MYGTMMIFRRELRQYFVSPVTYLITAAFLFLTAFLFVSDLTLAVTVRAANPAVIPSALSFFLVFLAPVLTMRLLAEEAREGTMELLLTAPVREGQIVLGKFLSAWAYFSLLLGITLIYQAIAFAASGTTEIGVAFSAYIGIWLYGGATLAVGLFFSALTENQVVAAFLSIAALMVLWLGNLAGEIVANIELARAIRNLTLPGHFAGSFAVGLIRMEDIVYYAGIITLMLYASVRAVEARRWR
jgi:ABC-2 type transport system permease protein